MLKWPNITLSRGDAPSRSNIRYCLFLFALPVLAAMLPQLWVDMLVPRDQIETYLYGLGNARTAFPPAVIPSLYHYAIAASCTIVACGASLWYSATTLRSTIARDFERWPPYIIWLIGAALAIALLCVVFNGVVDDKTTKLLFERSGVTTIRPSVGLIGWEFKPPIAFNWDGRILGFSVYLAFTVAALTCAVAATTAPAIPVAPAVPALSEGAVSPTPQKGPASERMAIIRISLFLATAVMLAAMITAKLRFDVGLAAMGAPTKGAAANVPYEIYQSVANAISAYWSVVLSLALAALYVPPAMVLNPPYVWEKGEHDKDINWFSLNHEGTTKILRLMAILSPPIVNQIITTMTA